MGPRTEPWGTPYFNGKDEVTHRNSLCSVGKIGYEPLEHSATEIPKEYDNLLSKIL